MAETVADRARSVAVLIRSLDGKIVSLYSSSEPIIRLAGAQSLTTEIVVNSHPVITWIERNRNIDLAQQELGRLYSLQQDVEQCVQIDVPEYIGGVKKTDGNPSDALIRMMPLYVFCLRFAEIFDEWANDIESQMKRERAAQSPLIPEELEKPEFEAVPPNKFRFKTDEYEVRPLVWNLIKALLEANKGTLHYDELALPVWGDREEPVDDNNLGPVKRDTNRFFKQNHIQLFVKVKNRYCQIVPCPSNARPARELPAVRPRKKKKK